MASSLQTSALKTYMVPLLALLAVGISVPLVILPGYGNITDTMDKIGQRQELKEALASKAQQLDAMDHEANKDLLQDLLEPAIPATSSPAGLLAQLEKLAQDNGLETRTSAYSNSESTSTATDAEVVEVGSSTSVTMGYAGFYDEISRFIAATEKSLRLTTLSNLHIVLDEAETNGSLLATVTVDGPFIPFLTDLGPEETPLPVIETDPESSPLLKKLSTYNVASMTVASPGTINGRNNPFSR